MSLIPSEAPPIDTDKFLSEYLDRMFRMASISDDQSDQLIRRNAIPDKLSIGKLYYFNAAIPTTAITGEGYWGYTSSGWVLIG